jgi:hypothetical protein
MEIGSTTTTTKATTTTRAAFDKKLCSAALGCCMYYNTFCGYCDRRKKNGDKTCFEKFEDKVFLFNMFTGKKGIY